MSLRRLYVSFWDGLASAADLALPHRLVVLRLIAFLQATHQYRLALPLLGHAISWQWRKRAGEGSQPAAVPRNSRGHIPRDGARIAHPWAPVLSTRLTLDKQLRPWRVVHLVRALSPHAGISSSLRTYLRCVRRIRLSRMRLADCVRTRRHVCFERNFCTTRQSINLYPIDLRHVSGHTGNDSTSPPYPPTHPPPHNATHLANTVLCPQHSRARSGGIGGRGKGVPAVCAGGGTGGYGGATCRGEP